VVSHDLDGEYGHGTHVLCAAALTEAITLAEQSDQYPESAKKFGTHRVEKTYLHLYEENKIEMDWDTPYESLGGKTPFQMTQEGFDCHKSQHWTWFKRWIYGNNGEITKATQIKTYSPCQFGLYDTTVGPDQKGGDFMENVTTYAEREAKEQQDAASQNIPKPIVPSAPKDEGGIPPLVWWIGGGALLLALIIFGIARKKRTRRGYRRRGGRIRI
jgi:hypothetical protein